MLLGKKLVGVNLSDKLVWTPQRFQYSLTVHIHHQHRYTLYRVKDEADSC